MSKSKPLPSTSLSKRKIVLISVLIIFLLASGIIFIYSILKQKEKLKPQVPKEKTMEEILQDLTAPATGERLEVPEAVLKNLTAPGQKETPEDILKNLTAPSPR